ncbi:MAG: hypothetical protein IKS63_00925 [Firmicutes bacterium]|nr:hypothetical protein [Bacillota bacterium]
MIFDKLDLRHKKAVRFITGTKVQRGVLIYDVIKGAEREAEGSVVDYNARGLHEIFNMPSKPDMGVYAFLIKFFSMVTALAVFSRTNDREDINAVEAGVWRGISEGYEELLSEHDQAVIAEEVFYADRKKPEFPKTTSIFSDVFYAERLDCITEDDYFEQLAPAMEYVLKNVYQELNDYLDGVNIVSNEDVGVVRIGDQRINTKLK